MQNEISPSGLILPRDDDPPFFAELRAEHNNRNIRRAWRKRMGARFRNGARKLFGK